MENPIETVALKLSEEEKDLIVNLKSANDIQMRNNLYSTPALNEFFRLWSVHFPSVKQSINCKGCRETVVKFYGRVADFISNERLLASQVKLAEFKDIVGGDAEYNASKIIELFEGKESAFLEIVSLNSAAGLVVMNQETDFLSAYKKGDFFTN